MIQHGRADGRPLLTVGSAWLAMRTLIKVATLLSSLITLSMPARAGHLTIVDDNPISFDAHSSQWIEQPWPSERPHQHLVERPFAELLATKLGIAQGKVELFRFQIENAPSRGTMLNGVVDGVGVKLKLTW